ncbi:MAG: membrane protein insertase YidC, partial [Rikenellaceae bacterium]
MDKNSIIGLVMIGVILFGFSWYGQKQQTEVLKEKARIDSIAASKAPITAQPIQNITPAADSQQLVAANDSTVIA